MPLSTTYTLQINGSNVHVTLKRMSIAFACKIKSTGEVTLSAPLGTSKAHISEFVRSKADWIRTQQAKQVDSPAARAERASREVNRAMAHSGGGMCSAAGCRMGAHSGRARAEA